MTQTHCPLIYRPFRVNFLSEKSENQDDFASLINAVFSVANWTISWLPLFVNFATIFIILNIIFLSLEVLVSPSTTLENIPKRYLLMIWSNIMIIRQTVFSPKKLCGIELQLKSLFWISNIRSLFLPFVNNLIKMWLKGLSDLQYK